MKSLKFIWKNYCIGLLALGLAGSVCAAPNTQNLLPNPGFETPGPTPNSPLPNIPENWTAYEWGPGNNPFQISRRASEGRNGGVAVLAQNKSPRSRAGIFTHVPLTDGTYELSVWAKAEKGQTAKVQLYLASAYSRVFTVGDQWQRVQITNFVLTDSGAGMGTGKGAEISIQNVSGRESTVWFSDAALRPSQDTQYRMIPDTRPDRPRTLLLSPINVNYLRDTASDWAARGIGGFMLTGIMTSQDDNPWAADGDPTTQGEADAMLKAFRDCNAASKKAGIDANFLYAGLRNRLPDPFDDAGWQKLTENFRQGARFAKLSDCVGISLDTEYVSAQYQPSWSGYAQNPRPLPELKAKFKQRWIDITAAMLQEYPEMELAILPEGIMNYGELYQDLFMGIVETMAKAQAPGGVHVMTEATYHIISIGTLGDYAQSVQEKTQAVLPAELLPYWKQRCSVALGAWPLGYYRPIVKNGKRIGWSGRQETFGDEVVGSYADKSAWYSPKIFKIQMAGLNTFSSRYNWIYSHGDVFWQWTPEQKKHYESMVSNRIGTVLLPVVPNLNEYFEVLAQPQLAVQEKQPSP